MSDLRDGINDQMLQRAYAEFLEMPGLRITSRQAQRLWGLDESTCLQILGLLIDARFLCESGHGTYRRASDGEVPTSKPQMAKATMSAALPLSNREAV